MKDDSLGRLIANRRKELGMTQLDLARRMGVTDKAVSKWERDLSFPDLSSIPNLAETLDYSLVDLMQVKEKTGKPQKVAEKPIITLILTVVPLALGVAVLVLSILNQLDLQDGFLFMSIGLICLSLKSLLTIKKEVFNG
ncbi:helix-turn-helix domain-containing protein [Eremococcus coleocola]|uniref:DNA-binding helix-turn-helix protein n=1 Tax=Eremococcus coleocola ACS-139-V-Col8 TaxID=908337 RepID=E4KLQ5_9LACT|nr:helix-turn-helix transcriptional regulator [Eremococcus coleocola]EFR31994.1 DNA-binding helix-turn-helix protein [Eremococcus coleocola ACS-139-V-Col8]